MDFSVIYFLPYLLTCNQRKHHGSIEYRYRLPWQVHERGTVCRQLSAQPPHRLLPLKKNLNHFCLDCHSVCDYVRVYCSLTMFSALAAVCTVWLRYRNRLNYITLHYRGIARNRWYRPTLQQSKYQKTCVCSVLFIVHQSRISITGNPPPVSFLTTSGTVTSQRCQLVPGSVTDGRASRNSVQRRQTGDRGNPRPLHVRSAGPPSRTSATSRKWPSDKWLVRRTVQSAVDGPRPNLRTKKYCSLVNFGPLHHYQPT